jgi:HD-GYP domain-containing protein (c-di-GMP phosphodiesterase class II)
MGTLSLASDAGMGMPMEHGLQSAALAVRLGELAGYSDGERRDAFYISLMRYGGCTADSDLAAEVMGDEIAVRAGLFGADWGSMTDFLPRLARTVGLRNMPRTLAKMPKLLGSAESHCEVGDRLAARAGFDDAFRAALFQTFERWDGRGWPRKIKRDAIAPAMRLAQVAEEIDIGHRVGGVDAARALLKKRSGGALDPKLVEVFLAQSKAACEPLASQSAWRTAMASEPEPVRGLDEDQVDEVLRSLGDFAGLKSRFTRGHASGVAALARRAAGHLGLSNEKCRAIARAGLVHDIGRVTVSAAVWDKPGPLNDEEWERVRMHAYSGERILSRASCLAEIAEIAAADHERLDGSGYHRRLTGGVAGGVLAAADVYHAMIETRAHRPAHTRDAAAAQLTKMARDRVLSTDAVNAVLSAAEHETNVRPPRPAGLTDRELDVLRLVARGLTNKEVATKLDISTRTAGHHLEHIFEKIGVNTRAGATMFAMQHQLLE